MHQRFCFRFNQPITSSIAYGLRSVCRRLYGKRVISSRDAMQTVESTNLSNSKRTDKLKEATQILNGIDNAADAAVINTFLDLIHKEALYEEVQTVLKVMDSGIVSISSKSTLSYPLLLKMCILSKSVDISAITKVCHRMKRDQYRLRIHDSLMIKLIAKCLSFHDIQFIHSHINDGSLRSTNPNDVVMKTALINGYGKYCDTKQAMKVFNEITLKNTVCVNSMMTVLIKNHDHEEALFIYDEYRHSLCDMVTHMLAIKACSHLHRHKKGREIHRNINTVLHGNQSKEVMQCKHSLIHFYGHCCRDLLAARSLFNSIPDGAKNNSTLKTMVQCLIKNDKNTAAIQIALKYRNLMDESVRILVLNACITCNDYSAGTQIISSKDINNHRHRGSMHHQHTLIRFHFHFGDIPSAESIFRSIPDLQRGFISTNLMMTGYLQNNQHIEALELYAQTSTKRIDAVSHKLALKACAACGDLKRGKAIHSIIDVLDIEIQNTLIKLYGDCNALEEARNVYDSVDISSRNVVTLNAMMTALINNDAAEEALSLYHNCNLIKDEISHLLAIKACRILNDFERGKEVHSETNGNSSIPLKCALIDFYGHFGDISKCHKLYDSIPLESRDMTVIGVMMKALSSNLRDEEALDLYVSVDKECATNHVLDLLAVKCAGNLDDFELGTRIHQKYMKMNDNAEEINVHLLTQHIELRNALIDFCGKSGDVDAAKALFEINKADVIGIASMMNVLVQNDHFDEALRLYEGADHSDQSDSNAMHMIALKGCAMSNSKEKGHKICDEIRRIESSPKKDIKQSNQMVNSMIEFYGHCGDTKRVMDLFKSIPTESKTASNVHILLKVLMENEMFEDVLSVYDAYIGLTESRCHVMALKACNQIENGHQRGIGIFEDAQKRGILDLGFKHAMIHFHGKFKCLDLAEQVLMTIDHSERDAVTVGTMMTVYMNHELYIKALRFYLDHQSSVVNDTCTMLALKCCVSLNDYDSGMDIIGGIAGNGCDPHLELQLKHCMIHFHGHFLDVDAAEMVFDSIEDTKKSSISITSMMDAFCKKEMYSQCIELMISVLKDSKYKHIEPVPICIAMSLTAITNLECFDVGQEIHDHILNDNNLRWMLSDSDVLTNLLTMYGKAGRISVCKQLFEELEVKDVDVCNAMINCFGICGYLEDAVALFKWMRDDDMIELNRYSYIMVFNALGHHGQMDDCYRIWKDIEGMDLQYDAHVVGSIVDGFARMGQLTTAMDWIMVYEDFHAKHSQLGSRARSGSKAMWVALLSACTTYGDSILGDHVSKETLRRFPTEESAVLALQNKLTANAKLKL